jgi:hypothetical protein
MSINDEFKINCVWKQLQVQINLPFLTRVTSDLMHMTHSCKCVSQEYQILPVTSQEVTLHCILTSIKAKNQWLTYYHKLNLLMIS